MTVTWILWNSTLSSSPNQIVARYGIYDDDTYLSSIMIPTA